MATGYGDNVRRSSQAERDLRVEVATEISRNRRKERSEENKRRWAEMRSGVAKRDSSAVLPFSEGYSGLPNSAIGESGACSFRWGSGGDEKLPDGVLGKVAEIREYVDDCREGDGTYGREELEGVGDEEWAYRTFAGLRPKNVGECVCVVAEMLALLESAGNVVLQEEAVKRAGLTWGRFEVLRGRSGVLAKVVRGLGDARLRLDMERLDSKVRGDALAGVDNKFALSVLEGGHERFRREDAVADLDTTTIVVDGVRRPEPPVDPTGGEGILRVGAAGGG